MFGERWVVKQSEDSNQCFLEPINSDKKWLPIVSKNAEQFVFYDESGQPPSFDLPDVLEFKDDAWCRPYVLQWHIRTHLQEIAENALDFGHFTTVHTYHYYPELLDFKLDAHKFHVSMKSNRKVLFYTDESQMDITYHGMGVVVSEVYLSSGFTLKVLLMSTPTDEEHVHITIKASIRKVKNPLVRWLAQRIFPFQTRAEFTNDQPVWESKIYRERPMLCEAEKNIMRIRQWARQFY